MSISDIIMWTFVFIIATGFVTVVSTTVLLKRAKRAPKDTEQSHSDDEDDWKKGRLEGFGVSWRQLENNQRC